MHDEATYYEHKFRCSTCRLHFVVFSDYSSWPHKGERGERKPGQGAGIVYCPECGSTGDKAHLAEEVVGLIYEAVGL